MYRLAQTTSAPASARATISSSWEKSSETSAMDHDDHGRRGRAHAGLDRVPHPGPERVQNGPQRRGLFACRQPGERGQRVVGLEIVADQQLVPGRRSAPAPGRRRRCSRPRCRRARRASSAGRSSRARARRFAPRRQNERPEPPAEADPLEDRVGGVVKGEAGIDEPRRDLPVRNARLAALANRDEAPTIRTRGAVGRAAAAPRSG